MQFDITKFLLKLQDQAQSKQEAIQLIYQEIRDAENQKVGFLDQATENPDFYKQLGSHVDSYITHLKVLHNQLGTRADEELDEKVYQSDKLIIDRTLQLVKQLERIEEEKLGRVREEAVK